MRPVKKAFKAIDKPDKSLSEAKQVAHTCQYLVQIGNQIVNCVSKLNDQEQTKNGSVIFAILYQNL